MKNKKTIMFFSSLLIIIFHLWINIFERTSNFYQTEEFIRKLFYIGVDIFFFLSSYSITNNKSDNYKNFIKSRFIKIYLTFLIFSIIGSIYLKWDLKTFLMTISGIRLFISGGGSFLWFVPAIMIIYLLLPLYKKLIKNKSITPVIITIIIWLLLTIITSKFTSYNAIFIFTNRIPIILIGVLCAKYDLINKLNIKQYIITTNTLLFIGILLVCKFNNYNSSFIYDIFYIVSLPLTLGMILLVNLIPTNKIIDRLGSITLEMYALQMIFGYNIASFIYNTFKIPLLSNIITIAIIIILSLIYNYILNKLQKRILKK